jgi:hypothetical protein
MTAWTTRFTVHGTTQHDLHHQALTWWRAYIGNPTAQLPPDTTFTVGPWVADPVTWGDERTIHTWKADVTIAVREPPIDLPLPDPTRPRRK